MRINIPSSVVDPFYRYTREKIKICISNSKGGVTNLLNLDTISKELGDESSQYLLKYIQKQCCCSVIIKLGNYFLKK